MPDRVRILQVAAKLETTYGVDPTISWTADAVRPVGLPVLEIDFLDSGDRADAQHGGLGVTFSAAKTGRWGKVDITLELKGSGAAYSSSVRPEWDKFAQAAGLTATGTYTPGSERVEYTTADTGNFASLSLLLQSANKLFTMRGVITQPKISLEASKRGTITFTCVGMVTAITENNPAAQTLSALVPPIFLGQTASIGTFASTSNPALVLRKMDFDLGTTYTERPSAGATDGLAGFFITDRNLSVSADIETVPLTAFDPYTISAAAQNAATSTAVSVQVGSAQYNRVRITTGQWMFSSPRLGDANGLMTWSLSGPVAARSISTVGFSLGREFGIVVD